MSPSVRSLRRIPTFHWVPPVYSPVEKIELEQSDGTKTDITDRIFDGTLTDGITETIGNFNFLVDNSDQALSGKFSPYDELNVYMDYATSATTLRFKGKIEKVSNQNSQIRFSGRSVAFRVLGITVTQSFTNQYTHDILQSILDTYAIYVTQNNIDTTESTDTQISVNWYQKPFWECVQELCNKAGYDAYIDPSTDFNYFVIGTRQNSTEALVHNSNLIETGDFTPDLSVVKNRIIVYGGLIEGQQIIWTEEDSASIDAYDVRELIINDTNNITIDQAQARALYELSLNKDPPIVGEVSGLGLPTITPGDKIQISDPLNSLNPQYYAIQKYTHN